MFKFTDEKVLNGLDWKIKMEQLTVEQMQPYHSKLMHKPIKVFAYFNLHKKVFSLKALEGPERGRVIAHVRSTDLLLATGKVSEAGRQRVIKEKRKNVHAGIVGYYVTPEQSDRLLSAYRPYVNYKLIYNPYKMEQFNMVQVLPSTKLNLGEFQGAEVVSLSVLDSKPIVTAKHLEIKPTNYK